MNSSSTTTTSRQYFLDALDCKEQERPPIWIMRQAGRYLPEFMELRNQHGFLKMVRTPELACEITLQPLRRFPLDAAILFSDILVVCEALGYPYQVVTGKGIQMDQSVTDEFSIASIDPSAVHERLRYVPEALKLIKDELNGSHALLGFAGSPWTLASYMIDGGSSADFSKTKIFAYEHPQLFNKLLDKLTEATIQYLNMQIRSGVDMVQIFDSCAPYCIGTDYWDLSLRWIERIIESLPENFPVMLFAKGVGHRVPDLLKTGARGLSLDWTVELAKVRSENPGNYVLQGNLDPGILTTSPGIVEQKTLELLDSMRGQNGHVFNLGHGVTPRVKVECVEALINTVVNYKGKLCP